ncbi:MAG: rhodanese-like domain-containing protein [Chloroflexota bacterium]
MRFGFRGRRALWLCALPLAFALALFGCVSASKPPEHPTAEPLPPTQVIPVEGGGSYTDVSAAGLAAMLRQKDFLLVNVHIPYEGEIEPTDLFIPYNEVGENLGRLPQDKDARVVLYCRSGPMSDKAARVLVQEGYTDVWNLEGGMNSWRQAGYALANKKR